MEDARENIFLKIMASSVEYWSEKMVAVSTEAAFWDLLNVEKQNELDLLEEENEPLNFYTSISLQNDVIIVSIIVALGLVLNSIVLGFYWKVKSPTAVYIRVFAVGDLFVMVFLAGLRVGMILSLDKSDWFFAVQYGIATVVGALNVIGPLFLALDRFLIVAFPHNFFKHERKLKIAKIVWVVCRALVSSSALVSYFVFSGLVLTVSLLLWTIFIAVEIIACAVVYTVIAVLVAVAGRKLKNNRHVGST